MINEKSSNAKPILIFVILFAVIIISSSIVYLAMFKKPSPAPVQPSVNPETTTMPEINVADWQTYKNEEYGFEVKYPQDFEGEEPDSGDVLLGAEKTEGGSSYYLTIKARPNYKVDQIVSSVKDAEKITVGDRAGYKYFYIEGIGESGVALMQIEQDGLSITFDSIGNSRNFANAGDRKIYVQNMLDKILSTLKFTEKDETVDWNVYRNEKYGYKIKYPKDWRIATEYIRTIADISSDPKNTSTENDFIVLTKLSLTEEKEFLEFAEKERGIALSPYFNFGLGKTITILPIYGNKEDLYKEINDSIIIKSSNIRDMVLSGITITRYRRYEATDNGIFDYESALIPYDNINNLTSYYNDKKYNYIEIRIERNDGDFEENVFDQMLSTIRFDKP